MSGVSFGMVAALALGILVALVGPVALLAFWCRRKGASPVPALVGAVLFYIAVFVLETRVLLLILGNPAAQGFLLSFAPVYALWGGLMAGLFEESARLLGLWILVRRYRGVENAVSYGIGHGGIEAVLLAGLNYLFSLVAVIWAGVAGPDRLPGVLGMSAELVEVLAATSPGMILAGSLERVFAVAVHIALTVLVWLAVTRRGWRRLYPTAIGLHALVNLGAGLYQAGAIRSVWAVEIYTGVAAAVVCLVAWWAYHRANRGHSDLMRYDPL